MRVGSVVWPSRKAIGAAVARARRGEPSEAWLGRIIKASGFVQMAGRTDADSILVTAQQISRRFGVSMRTVRNWIRQGLPVAMPGSGNQPAWYDVFVFVRWWIAREEAKRVAADESLMEGEKSRYVVDFQRERAREAKRKNDIEEGKLVEAIEVAVQLEQIGRIFREGVETISRVHGDEIGEEVRRLIDRAEVEWKRTCRESG